MGLYSPRSFQTHAPPSFAPSPDQSIRFNHSSPKFSVSWSVWFVQFYWLFWLAVSFLISFAASNAFWGGL